MGAWLSTCTLLYVVITHRFNVLHQVHDRGVRSERFKHLSLVQQGVHKVWVVMETMGEARVNDLQYHLKHLLQDGQVSRLQGDMGVMATRGSKEGGGGWGRERGRREVRREEERWNTCTK